MPSPVRRGTERISLEAVKLSGKTRKRAYYGYNELLKREELYWIQRSRAGWLTQGECISKYFHVLVIAKIARSKILQLKNA